MKVPIFTLGGFINTKEGWNLRARHGGKSPEYLSAKQEWERFNGKDDPRTLLTIKNMERHFGRFVPSMPQKGEERMNEMQIYNKEEFGELRTVMRDGEPWFVAADVCRVLDIAKSRDAVSRLDMDEKDAVG